MAYDYIEIGGKEFLNPSRTLAYIENHLPGLDVECDVPNIGRVLGDFPYREPGEDGAPWVTSDEASLEFYGGITTRVIGLRDSTQSSEVAELKYDGGIPGLRRNASREISFTVALYAKTSRGLDYGVDWYAHALSGGYCPSYGIPYCEGEMLSVMPIQETMNEMAPRIRHYYDVMALQSVRVIDTVNYRNAKSNVVEFILIAGNPFIYRAGPLASRRVLAAEMTGNHTERKCNPEDDAYDQLITDPALGSVIRPPKPPLIDPVDMPSSWRRTTTTFTAADLDRPGQAVFRTRIRSSGTLRRLRLRFYRPGAANCDYSGEFFISYKPPGDDLVIDGLSHKIWVERGGRNIPSSNLVIGSDGRPATWPVLDCREPVTVAVDYPTAPSNLTVDIEAHNRR